MNLASGEQVVADADYVRESIVTPAARVVSGYQPIMPTYQGLVSEEGLMQVIAYIQSLQEPTAAGAPMAVAPDHLAAPKGGTRKP